jgi:tetratricopeptide (TPR) repeat protein
MKTQHQKKKYSLSLYLFCAMLFSACCINPQDLYTRALHNIEINRLDAAERMLQKVIELKPDFANAWYSLGFIYMQQERYNEAIPMFEKSLEFNANDTDTLVNIGSILVKLNRPSEAEPYYIKAVSTNPNSNTIILNLARLLAQQRKFRDARLLYEKILRSQPGLFSANRELAYLLLEEGRFEDALQQFSKAAQLQKNDSEILYEIGVLYFKQGRYNTASRFLLRATGITQKSKYFLALGYLYEATNQHNEAITAFSKAYDLNKSSFEATFKLGVLHLEKEMYEKAQFFLRTSLELNSRSAESHKYLGILLYKTGHHSAAGDYFENARKINRFVNEIYYYKALIALQDGLEQKAMELLQQEVEQFSGNENAWWELARIYLKNEQYEKSLELVKSGLDKSPRSAKLWELSGDLNLLFAEKEKKSSGLYMALEFFDEAINAYRNTLEYATDRMPALKKILTVFDGAKRYGAAVPFAEKLLEKEPDNELVNMILARGHIANQNFDKAIEQLGKYLLLKPDDAEGWFELGKIHADKGEFNEGIEYFRNSAGLDPEDPRKKMFVGMLLAEVNQFHEALSILQEAITIADKSKDLSIRKRCEDLIRQIVEVSGIEDEKVKTVVQEAKSNSRKETKKKIIPGGASYVKLMLSRTLRQFRIVHKKGMTEKNKRKMLAFIRYRLIEDYKKLAKKSSFKNRETQRLYYLGIRRLIMMVKES